MLTYANASSTVEELTPSMKQYWELKRQAGDALLLFRMGDFYELFGDDAIEASKILQITLTSRDRNKPNPIPMAGVPYTAAPQYIQKLLKVGKKVAIGDQVGEPTGKGIVPRELTRILSPAIDFEIEGAEERTLATCIPSGKDQWVVAFIDPSTGKSGVGGPFSEREILREISTLSVRHFLSTPETPESVLRFFVLEPGVLVEPFDFKFSSEKTRELILKSYPSEELSDLRAFFPVNEMEKAFGTILQYLLKSQLTESLGHLRLPKPIERAEHLQFQAQTPQHLDLFPKSGEIQTSLYERINYTRSSLGARTLRRWLSSPLRAPHKIAERQEQVKELGDKAERLLKLSAVLSEVYDLERIGGRIAAGLANPRDLLSLGQSLSTLPTLLELLPEEDTHSLRPLVLKILSGEEKTRALTARILKSLKNPAPLHTHQGDLIQEGVDPELDRLRVISRDGEKWLLDFESNERKTTGISTLKIKFNRVFGYGIEIPQSQTEKVPAHYIRKQTLSTGERYFTAELKRFEEELSTSETRMKKLEQDLFKELLGLCQKEIQAILEASEALGSLDALSAFATLSREPGWVFPEIDSGFDFFIEGGRHPLVDQPGKIQFSPNGIDLKKDTEEILIVTGPNMGGKSTYLRQTALFVVLGQAGAPIPARSGKWGAFHSVFTRIGAHDAISKGQSTFMVEMTELAQILHHADERSLLILDEVGRGTATFDGLSIAWAALEWIATQIKSRTLFATHYHELTSLSQDFKNIRNVHLSVEEKGSEIRFTYQVKPGPASESFGIQVAKMAGLPKAVIEKSRRILNRLEKYSPTEVNQFNLFNQEPAETERLETTLPEEMEGMKTLLMELSRIDIEKLTPIDSLLELSRFSGRARILAEALPSKSL